MRRSVPPPPRRTPAESLVDRCDRSSCLERVVAIQFGFRCGCRWRCDDGRVSESAWAPPSGATARCQTTRCSPARPSPRTPAPPKGREGGAAAPPRPVCQRANALDRASSSACVPVGPRPAPCHPAARRRLHEALRVGLCTASTACETGAAAGARTLRRPRIARQCSSRARQIARRTAAARYRGCERRWRHDHLARLFVSRMRRSWGLASIINGRKRHARTWLRSRVLLRRILDTVQGALARRPAGASRNPAHSAMRDSQPRGRCESKIRRAQSGGSAACMRMNSARRGAATALAAALRRMISIVHTLAGLKCIRGLADAPATHALRVNGIVPCKS